METSHVHVVDCASPASSVLTTPREAVAFGSARKGRSDDIVQVGISSAIAHLRRQVGTLQEPLALMSRLSPVRDISRSDGDISFSAEDANGMNAPRKRRLALGLPDRLEELAADVAAQREETSILRRQLSELEARYAREHAIVVEKLEKASTATCEESRALKVDMESMLSTMAEMQGERQLEDRGAQDRSACEMKEYHQPLHSLKVMLDDERSGANESNMTQSVSINLEAEMTRKIDALQGVVKDTLQLIGDASMQTFANAASESEMKGSVKRRVSDVTQRIDELLKDDQLQVAPQLRAIQHCLTQERSLDKGGSISVDGGRSNQLHGGSMNLPSFITRDEFFRELDALRSSLVSPWIPNARASPRPVERVISYRASVPVAQVSQEMVVVGMNAQRRLSRSPSPSILNSRALGAPVPLAETALSARASKESLGSMTQTMQPASSLLSPASLTTSAAIWRMESHMGSHASLPREDSLTNLRIIGHGVVAPPDAPPVSARLTARGAARSLSPIVCGVPEAPMSARFALSHQQLPTATPRSTSPTQPLRSSLTNGSLTARSTSSLTLGAGTKGAGRAFNGFASVGGSNGGGSIGETLEPSSVGVRRGGNEELPTHIPGAVGMVPSSFAFAMGPNPMANVAGAVGFVPQAVNVIRAARSQSPIRNVRTLSPTRPVLGGPWMTSMVPQPQPVPVNAQPHGVVGSYVLPAHR